MFNKEQTPKQNQTTKKSFRKEPTNQDPIELVQNKFCELFLYQKFIKGPQKHYMAHNEFKTDYEELYNDIYDIENNIVYIEENFMDQPLLTKEDHENELEHNEVDIEFESTDDELETNEWMFNMY